MLQNFGDYGYLGVFVALIAAGFGFPIPEELPVITAGILVGHEDTKLRWYIMLPVVITGVVIGDGFLYGVGRIWGQRLLKIGWVQRKLLPPQKREEIEKNFADRGIMVLLGARLLPGIRSSIFIMAGMLRVPLGRFLLADGLYAIPLVNVLFWAAYMLTDQVLIVYGMIQRVQHEYGALVSVIVLSAVLGVLVYKYLITRHVSTGEPPHVPPIISKPAESLGHVLESVVDKMKGRPIHEQHEEGGKADEGAQAPHVHEENVEPHRAKSDQGLAAIGPATQMPELRPPETLTDDYQNAPSHASAPATPPK
jgi:membrane protein DedA with SNARE-associated domain